jgi:putative ABC transport system substrate-binding protein
LGFLASGIWGRRVSRRPFLFHDFGFAEHAVVLDPDRTSGSRKSRTYDMFSRPASGSQMKRREFITLFGGTAAAWPLIARAQQSKRMRRIGVLQPAASDDLVFLSRLAAFNQELSQLGWMVGRDVQIDVRWATTDAAEIRRQAAELVALSPDVILAAGESTMPPLLQATRTIPIVFPVVSDPVALGYVDSLARPGGNATGFMIFEYSMGVKWLELLKEIAPSLTRVAVMRDPAHPSQTAQFGIIQAVAPSFRLEVSPVNMREASEIEQSVKTFARTSNGGLIVTSSGAAIRFRDLLVTLAARHKLPTVYWERFYVTSGGLISYGADLIDQYQRAAGYVDRILKGEKPADLPVQAPTKYELAINLKTAKALDLIVPPTLLARADAVIE